MGWLDHSTNNIILDAVLTDYGRSKLAKSDFKTFISKFALADDEVDYRLIQRYGRTVGKEKIEKNTPVFEALTNQNTAIKYRLIGKEGTTAINSVRLPQLSCTRSSIDLTPTVKDIDVTFTLSLGGSTDVGSFNEDTYVVEISDRFFTLTSAGSEIDKGIDPTSGDPNRVKRYTVTVKNGNTSFSIKVNKRTIDDTTLSIYGKWNGTKRKITSYMTVVGKKFGTTLTVPVTYEAT